MWKTLCVCALATVATAAEWTIPVMGNAYRTTPGPGTIGRGEVLRAQGPQEVYSIYFHADRPAELRLGLVWEGEAGEWRIHAGQERFVVRAEKAAAGDRALGTIQTRKPGYVRVDLSCPDAQQGGGGVRALQVSSDTEGLKLHFVPDNKDNMFYWGRRGPSVHLGYELPRGRDLEWAYSEITVPDGLDPVGSYFMANGFGQGYFGIQVNSLEERRVLFSVWSPHQTDHPQEIPEADRIVTLAKGAGVQAQDFGGEGSGGQSFLVYPWRAGVTYRFLTRVRPNGEATTTFTSWFGEKSTQEWRLIASFRRPRTDTHLAGFHSFLENFAPDQGAVPRAASYGNQWVANAHGEWTPITRARLTADNTARKGFRLDYAGGTTGKAFFLKNCGFFDERVELDQWFERPTDRRANPGVDLDELPME